MKRFFIILLAVALPLSCGKLKGEFSFRMPGDQGYKRNLARCEFNAASTVEWMYSFESVSKRVSIGVIILKKELGWIDILTSQDYVDEVKITVLGKLSGLEPGDYKLVLTEMTAAGSRTIDELEFYIYSDEEPLDEPFED